MDQYVAIRDTRIALQKLIASVQDQHLVTALNGIDRALAVFHDRGIDFKEVTDHLDDSLLITDADGIVLYINLAYTKNTGITEEDVLGKDIHQLIGTDKLFTGGAVCSVLEGKNAGVSSLYNLQDGAAPYGIRRGHAAVSSRRKLTAGGSVQPPNPLSAFPSG